MWSLPRFSSQLSSASNHMSSLALADDERARMIAFLQELVRTPSPPTQEGAVADLIIQECRAGGITDVRTDAVGNVCVRLGTGEGPVLVYDAHMDTVLPANSGWLHEPYAGVIEDGVLYGMGACDTKGAIASMVFAARHLVQTGVRLDGKLILSFVVQEEPCEGCGLKGMLEVGDIKPDWVVLGEPSDLGVMRGHRGRVLFKITVLGRSSHSSNPQLGTNAITAAARLLFGIELLSADLPVDPFLGPGTIAVTHIESQAVSKNAIPDLCSFYVDRRLTLGETPTRAQSQIEAVIQREGIQAEIEIIDYHSSTYTGYPLQAHEAFSPWALEEEHPLVQAMAEVIRALSGQPPHVGESPFSTDGVYSMGVANIPTVGFGPGDPKHAHTPLEQVKLDDVALTAQIYALLAVVLLGENNPG